MKHILFVLLLAGLFATSSCKKFLDEKPQALLTSDNLLTKEGVDGLVTDAYHSIGTYFQGISSNFLHPVSNWSFGDARSDDAYKGGGGTGDITEYTLLEVCNITPDNIVVFDKWQADYIAISNINKA